MTSRLFAALNRARVVLSEGRVEWALVGGLAVSVRSDPRFTRDVDLVVAVASDDAAEALVHRFLADGFSVLSILEHDTLRRLATVRLLAPGESPQGIILDLLFSSSGIEPEICAAAESITVAPGVKVPVATTGHLLAQKVLSRNPKRLQDDLDIQQLRREADDVELARCGSALALIMQRGANRGKDLLADFSEHVLADSGE